MPIRGCHLCGLVFSKCSMPPCSARRACSHNLVHMFAAGPSCLGLNDFLNVHAGLFFLIYWPFPGRTCRGWLAFVHPLPVFLVVLKDSQRGNRPRVPLSNFAFGPWPRSPSDTSRRWGMALVPAWGNPLGLRGKGIQPNRRVPKVPCLAKPL